MSAELAPPPALALAAARSRALPPPPFFAGLRTPDMMSHIEADVLADPGDAPTL